MDDERKLPVGTVVRGPYGRRYQVIGESTRGLIPVQRVKVNGQLDMRCGKYAFPADYLTPMEARDG